jgi:hypothetical protein
MKEQSQNTGFQPEILNPKHEILNKNENSLVDLKKQTQFMDETSESHPHPDKGNQDEAATPCNSGEQILNEACCCNMHGQDAHATYQDEAHSPCYSGEQTSNPADCCDNMHGQSFLRSSTTKDEDAHATTGRYEECRTENTEDGREDSAYGENSSKVKEQSQNAGCQQEMLSRCSGTKLDPDGSGLNNIEFIK